MTKYKAVVVIEFDDEDIQELKEGLDVPEDQHLDPLSCLEGSLDNLDMPAVAWVNNFFIDD